uniref:VOC domain-containing protein n=1 Tax=Penicillium chrysogenum TaxID=5076 RepID=Q3HUR6_PENCH|nr:hypothetical protein [Penicillium chrysogenum]
MMSSNIDHLGITAPDGHFESLVEWYKKALSPLGYKEIMRFPGMVGLGSEIPDFWITQKETHIPSGFHFAFTAPNRAAVDAFHTAAIDAGGTCNGKPGLRPEYHENYYGAFVLDPIGNNVELVSPGTLFLHSRGLFGDSRLAILPKTRRSNMLGRSHCS